MRSAMRPNIGRGRGGRARARRAGPSLRGGVRARVATVAYSVRACRNDGARSPCETMDLNLLAVFEAVARTSSFSAAAKELGIPKSTASRAIARLEDELRVQ